MHINTSHSPSVYWPHQFDDLGMDPYETRVYLRLVRRANGGDSLAFESHASMEEGIGISRRKIIDCISSLEKRGLIRVTKRPGDTSIVTLLPLPVGAPHALGCAPDAEGVCTTCVGTCAPHAHKEYPYEDTPLKKNKREVCTSEPRRFTKPTVDEVWHYMQERKHFAPRDEAQYFWDWHQSKGWVIGKAPMKDWKAAVRTWLSRPRRQSSLPTMATDPIAVSREASRIIAERNRQQ